MTNHNAEVKRILLVEDDDDAREIVIFNLNGHRFVTASDFTDGLRLARQRYFDIYILGDLLPDGTGADLCRRIREFDPHTPVVFFSSGAYQFDVRETLIDLTRTYIVKPGDLDELQWAVARLTSFARERAFEARQAELAAVREELTIRQVKNAERVEQAKERLLRAEEKVVRAKAESAFLAAEGSRGEFARLWPTVFLEEVRSSRNDGNVP
jgi:DNA-binding response OmpR family regulator